ncbi:hypothetical protein [Leifsonia sp. A12D58]|uniref:hypothetical protein n=1 Tax=Leifsonia sp. A12D58 TaxID=3397674 RepID=UPI0039DF4209
MPTIQIVARIRRLTLLAALAAVGYGALTTASASYCPGGSSVDGPFTDAAGNVIDPAQSCISLTLHPSFFVYVGIIAIVIGSLNSVLRRAGNLPTALRYLDRAAAWVVILALASVVISQIWFAKIPITTWNGAATFYYPFPFGSVDLLITPMNTN